MDIYQSNTLSLIDYLVISKKDLVINSIKGLKNKNVSIVLGSKMHELCLQNDIKTNKYSNTDDLLRNIRNDSIVVIDKDTYEYYKNTKFKNHKIVYEGTLNNNYNFKFAGIVSGIIFLLAIISDLIHDKFLNSPFEYHHQSPTLLSNFHLLPVILYF